MIDLDPRDPRPEAFRTPVRRSDARSGRTRGLARALLLVLVAVIATPAMPAPALAADPADPAAGARPGDPGVIHGAGSDAGARVTLHDTVPAGAVETSLVETAITGPASCTRWTSDTRPPTTIRVYRTRTDTVETVDFRSYARKVVAGEFSRTWPFQLLAIGAIAAKQNAWYWSTRGRDWTYLSTYTRTRPIAKVTLSDGSYQWRTTAASSSGAGLCWDLTDNPALDQCYDCYATPIDPTTAPRNMAALDATWRITLRRPRSGTQSFFAPGYAGRLSSTCPSMATQADWESWFTGNIDFYQASACVSSLGESATMLLRRFLSSALEIRDPARFDLTGDGRGDVPIVRSDPATPGQLQLDPATADAAYTAVIGTVAPPAFAAETAPSVVRAVGRLDRSDRASLVTLAVDATGGVSVVARSLDAPGKLRSATWWKGTIPGLDPASSLLLEVDDMTGDFRPDVALIERARTTASDGSAAWSLRLWVLQTTDAGAATAFGRWVAYGPFASATRFERLGDVDGDGRADLVFALGNETSFRVARVRRNGSAGLLPSEAYGGLAVPANPADWRFFALADGTGTGRDEPVIGATGAAAAAIGGSAVPFAIQNATASSYPVGYTFSITPLRQTWSGSDSALLAGQMWAGDVSGDARAELGVVNAAVSTGPILVSDTSTARLAIVAASTGAAPATSALPVVGPGPLEHVRVIAPGEQRTSPADSRLARLVSTAGTLLPAFSPDVTAYTGVVDATVTSVRVRPYAASPWATIAVAGRAATSGVLGGSIPLALGANRIPIVVTDLTSRTEYVLTVVRASKPPAPTITRVTAPLGGLIRVYWASNGDGGSPITSWVVQRRLAGTTAWTGVSVRPTAFGHTFSGLEIGRTYEVRVVGRNIVGVGAPSLRWSIRTR